jgi:hypothetical protein
MHEVGHNGSDIWLGGTRLIWPVVRVRECSILIEVSVITVIAARRVIEGVVERTVLIVERHGVTRFSPPVLLLDRVLRVGSVERRLREI